MLVKYCKEHKMQYRLASLKCSLQQVSRQMDGKIRGKKKRWIKAKMENIISEIHYKGDNEWDEEAKWCVPSKLIKIYSCKWVDMLNQ